jgi:hypothetical protein
LIIIPFVYCKKTIYGGTEHEHVDDDYIDDIGDMYKGGKHYEKKGEHYEKKGEHYEKKGGAKEEATMREDGEPDKKSKNWVDSLSLIDPRFNMREAAKQMILLEDHLFHNNKHCLDCISKHTLFIEGLLEEGISMDSENKYRKELVETLTKIKELMPHLIEKMKLKKAVEKDYVDAGNRLRQIRKPIAKCYSFFKV